MLDFSLSGNSWFNHLPYPILFTHNRTLVYWNASAQTTFHSAEWLKEESVLPSFFPDSANCVTVLTLCNQQWELYTQTVNDGLLYELHPLADADIAFSRQRISQLALQMHLMLSSFLASVDLLHRSLDSDDQSKTHRSLCYMNHSLHKLLRLTDNLDFCSQTDDVLLYSYPPAACNLCEICYELESTLEWAAEKANRCFSYDCSTNNAIVAINETLFRRLIYNLVSNAFRAGGDITMTLECIPCLRPQRVIITLADTGCGFAPEQLYSLYSPSEKPSTSTTRPQGFALGLPICYRIATLYKGTLLVNCSPDATGSEIILSFPLCKPSESNRLNASTIFYPESISNQVLIELSDVLPFECYRKEALE